MGRAMERRQSSDFTLDGDWEMTELAGEYIYLNKGSLNVVTPQIPVAEVMGVKIFTADWLPDNEVYMLDCRGKVRKLVLKEEVPMRLIRED
jgi:hypothetical protein